MTTIYSLPDDILRVIFNQYRPIVHHLWKGDLNLRLVSVRFRRAMDHISIRPWSILCEDLDARIRNLRKGDHTKAKKYDNEQHCVENIIRRAAFVYHLKWSERSAEHAHNLEHAQYCYNCYNKRTHDGGERTHNSLFESLRKKRERGEGVSLHRSHTINGLTMPDVLDASDLGYENKIYMLTMFRADIDAHIAYLQLEIQRDNYTSSCEMGSYLTQYFKERQLKKRKQQQKRQKK